MKKNSPSFLPAPRSCVRFVQRPLACVAALLFLACAAGRSRAGEPGPAGIPLNEIGAKATADYKGDALSLAPDAGGAVLRCGFQKLEGRVTPEGLSLTSTEDGGGVFRLVAAGLGREGADPAVLPPHGVVSVSGKTAIFSRPGLVEEYSVSMDGVRQDFLVAERPAGAGRLRLSLALEGARTERAAGGAKITLEGAGRELAYSRLRVTDAAGHELAASMEAPAADQLAVCVEDAGAAYPIRIDPTFSDADWVALAPSTAMPGADNTINTIAVQGTNVYVGGTFTFIGNVSANRVARWDGSAWSPLGTAAQNGCSSSVLAIAVASATEIYVGGSFSTVADSNGTSIAAGRIARWNPSTSSWSRLGTAASNGTTVSTQVNAIAAVSPSEVYVGGTFTTVADAGGSQSANRIAKWDGSAWSPLGSATQNGADNTVSAIAVASASEIYAGGSFTTVSDAGAAGVGASRIAKWNGSAWSPLGTATQNGTSSSVTAISVLSAGEVYVGGAFTTVRDANGATIPANKIAKWNGSSWSPLGTPTQNGSPTSGIVLTIAALSPTEIYVGGTINTVADYTSASISVNRVARWNSTTSTWSRLGSSTQNGVAGGTFGVNAIAAVSSSEVYLGGSFLSVADSAHPGIGAARIAKWNGGTSLWTQVPVADGVTGGTVRAVAVSGTDIYAGGDFLSIGAVTANRVARWDGSAWSPLGTVAQNGAGGTVNALAVVSPTEVYVGGSFATVADSTSASLSANRIAKWDKTSGTWSRLGTATQNGVGTGAVNAISALSASDVYVGGSFTTVSDATGAGLVANRVVRWNGSAWSRLGTATQNGVSGTVNAIHALSPTAIYVGGIFTTASDSLGASRSANRVAKWDSTAAVWSPLGTGALNGTGGTVNAIAALSTSEVYVGGGFTTVADNSGATIVANRIARWNEATGRWAPLGSATQNGVNSTLATPAVNAIVAQSSTAVFVAGEFITVSDATAVRGVSRFAKWDGSIWSALGNGLDAPVRALAADSGGNLILGGDFFSAGFTPKTISPFLVMARFGVPEIGVEQPAGTNLVAGTASVSFSTVDVGFSGTAKTFNILNGGTGPLKAVGVSVTGGNAADFTVNTAGMQPNVFPALGTTFSVTFTPSAEGSRSTTLRIVSDDADENPFDITLTGTGNLADMTVQQPVGTTIADGGEKSFGSTVAGSPLSLAFTITNPSPGTLSVNAFSIDGPDASDFTAVVTPGVVAPGGSRTFTAQFNPAAGAAGLRTGVIHLFNNAPGKNPYDITLKGTAISFTTDTDGDGLNDASEFQLSALGFDPAVNQAALVGTLFSNLGGAQTNLNAAGFFTTAQVQAMNVGARFIQRDPLTGQFLLELELEKAADLQNFLLFPFTAPGLTITPEGRLRYQFVVPGDTAFFRLNPK